MNQLTDINNEKICIGLQEQEQDIRQVLFKLLIKDVSQEIVLKVWYIRATGTSGIGYYMVLLNNSTHLYTCLLLMNKSLICRHFFRVATYSQSAIYYITLISALRLLEKLGSFGKLAKCRNSETLPKLYESLIKKLAKLWRKAKPDKTYYKC
ncbi:hypothetical protein RhiirC2_783170 [Rhizophagus irregularis]|uniref:Uncharacterized protein n=1 Tax=Rhizophagus irregularis TaxID=588596 RepID=A0A2N1N195_9GLOM|nr:hypothetical protein RhiirC2_783170 [Rhizophagus irregularis]